MKKTIKQKLKNFKNFIPLSELKEKRRKKADKDKKNYHEFYARSSMPASQWLAMLAKRKDH